MSRLTDAEIEAGIAHLEHGFMTPSIWKEDGAIVANVAHDSSFDSEVPASETGELHVIEATKGGWWCQLSASGYMDQTDIAGPFDSEREAAEYLCETYADDIQDCGECQEETEDDNA